MKKITACLCVITVLLMLASCNTTNNDVSNIPQKTSSYKEETNMQNIDIIINNKTFSAELYNNSAAGEFLANLPLTLDMSELNGNEKYYYLNFNLPTNQSVPSKINAGDIMLFGNDCLVLFYESFTTSYSYTPLGHINNPQGLKAALGSGNVKVTFKKG